MSILRDGLDGDLQRRGPRVVLAELVVGTLALASLTVFTAVASAHDAFLRAQLCVVLAIGLNWATVLLIALRRTIATRTPPSEAAWNQSARQRLLLALALLVPMAIPVVALFRALRYATR